MGGVASAPAPAPAASAKGGRASRSVFDEGRSFENMVQFMYPVYYTTSPLLPHEKDLAEKVWKDIVYGKTAEFTRLKTENPQISASTPMAYFVNIFFTRLLEVHPTCKGLFKGDPGSRGDTLVRMLSFILSKMGDQDKLTKCLDTLVSSHNKMGVKAVEFGIFGETIFHSLKVVAGPAYDIPTHVAWIKIYSSLLTYFIPRMVRFEMEHRSYFKRTLYDRMGAVLGAHVTCVADCPADVSYYMENTISHGADKTVHQEPTVRVEKERDLSPRLCPGHGVANSEASGSSPSAAPTVTATVRLAGGVPLAAPQFVVTPRPPALTPRAY